MVVAGSAKKAWWICSECGHSWYATIVNRNSGHGCPACKVRKSGKPIMCVDDSKVYSSMKEAAESIGVTIPALKYALKNNKSCGGFKWNYL